ncbi:MAG: hypothetical protein M0009_07945 [Deltaproteobacteria bacterium]|nr:hypothetical protein [Deltaproteobacteria bacterium]
MTNVLKAFLAGFASTWIFHQGLLWLLHALGIIPRVPYSFAPTAPFQIPQVVSLAFWGGLWGIPLWLAIRRKKASRYWLAALAFGALLPSLAAWFVVFPLKGQPVAGGWKPVNLAMALLLNGAWGIGAALLMKGMRKGR